MARDQQRVIITLDRDFAEYFYRTQEPDFGIIHLDLPIAQHFIGTINTVLQDFFAHHAGTIDLDHCLVIIDESTIQIVHPSGTQSGN
jgi:predicted nuclease of predicted toxin-antitoxin system